jgi:hypothetical protein
LQPVLDFGCGSRIDDAAELVAAAHFVDALVARETAAYRRAVTRLRDPVRVRDERPAERDEIGFAGVHRVHGDLGIAQPPDGNHRHRHGLLHPCGVIEKDAFGTAHRRRHHVRRRQRSVMTRRDVQRVRAFGRSPFGDL